ncbi:SDR family NAD(P)-dependent oxidoreductase [Candidatus Dependentiae bacterium]
MKKTIYFLLLVLAIYGVNKLINYLEYPKEISFDKKTIKKAIVVGATSGMGRQVAKILSANGYEVGLVGRRENLLLSLKKELPTKSYTRSIDVSKIDLAKNQLEQLIAQMGGLDLIFISVSAQGDFDFGTPTSHLTWEDIKKFIDVDLGGFWVAAHVAVKQFEKQGHGHLIGVSSIQKIHGSSFGPEYSGAKAFISKYLDGIRNRMIKNKLPIFVTEIIPGPVDVERKIYSDVKGLFWVITKEEAAKQIYNAIKNKKEKVYVDKKYRFIAWFLSIIPDWLYRKFE